MDRTNYFFGQQLSQAELDKGFDGAELADRNQIKDILGSGFLVNGSYPAAVGENTPQNLTVVVSKLLGYDQLGQRLNNDRESFQNQAPLGLPPVTVDLSTDEVAASTAVVNPGNEKTISIFVQFERNPSDPRVDENNVTVNFIQDESVKYNIVQSPEAPLGNSVPPALRPDQLLLADVKLVFGQSAIANADISQTRREIFTFGLTHGASHTEFGSDPIPNATQANGGLHSSADKTKLDNINFTGPGVGALLPNIAQPFQPANVTAPAATTLDVSTQMAGKSAGGSASVEGVTTQSGAPNNRVIVKTIGDDDFLDSLGNKVFGRITVNSEATPTVWTLGFFSTDDAGNENAFDMTPFAGQAIKWYVTETYRIDNLPTYGLVTVPSDEVAGDVPNGTTTTPGKLQLAVNNEVVATKAVKADDPRVFVRNAYSAIFSATTAALIDGASRIVYKGLPIIDDGAWVHNSTDGSFTLQPGFDGRYLIIAQASGNNSAATQDIAIIKPAGNFNVGTKNGRSQFNVGGLGYVATNTDVAIADFVSGESFDVVALGGTFNIPTVGNIVIVRIS